MLYKMGVGYNTVEGREIARVVQNCIGTAAENESRRLAKSKGVFPNWNKSVFAATSDLRRNAALTNIPPTGTIAMMFDVSGGVEPYFALAYYYKNILGGEVQLQYVNKHLKAALIKSGVYSDALLAEIIKCGSLQKIDGIPEHIRKTFVTSMDISAEDHIRMQATFQARCDNAISKVRFTRYRCQPIHPKTINFPNSATREDITKGYITAWEQGCKGCTVYRDGSRMEQVLNLNDSKSPSVQESSSGDAGKTYKLAAPPASPSACASCAVEMRRTEGCLECPSCGISKCEA
jgi:ribonucleoside-diphosphate reductase alpha chain